jgi:Family of unknown function (DUF6220)
MRAAYRILAMLVAIGVVLQAAFIAWGTFGIWNDSDNGKSFEKDSPGAGFSAHAVTGYLIVLIALVLLIVSFFARVPGGVKWAAITFGVGVLQIALAAVSFPVPILGVLHGLNAFALAGVASVAMRRARVAGEPAGAPIAASPRRGVAGDELRTD